MRTSQLFSCNRIALIAISLPMNPAHRIISKFGSGDFARGVAIVSEITGVHPTRIHRWTYPKERGGTGGLIPSQHQQKILNAASDLDAGVTSEDFFEREGGRDFAHSDRPPPIGN